MFNFYYALAFQRDITLEQAEKLKENGYILEPSKSSLGTPIFKIYQEEE